MMLASLLLYHSSKLHLSSLPTRKFIIVEFFNYRICVPNVNGSTTFFLCVTNFLVSLQQPIIETYMFLQS